jgi:hypothetical protein
MSETPALEGARRAHIECEINVDSLAYWNDPTGEKDQNFVSPFETQVSRAVQFPFVFYEFALIRAGVSCFKGRREVLDIFC